LIGNDEDRKYLYSLTEIEREEIIADRYQKRKEAAERAELKKTLNKGKGDIDSTRRVSNKRQKSSNEKNKASHKKAALSDLKKRRAKQSSTFIDDDDLSEGEIEDYTKDDSDEDDYYEEEKKKDKYSRNKSEEIEEEKQELQDSQRSENSDQNLPITCKDINDLLLKRSWVEKYHDQPFFNDLVIGFYIKIGIGKNPDTGISIYRATQIKDVLEGTKSQKLTNGKFTNKIFLLKHGNQEKKFDFRNISNQGISETEFKKLEEELEKANIPKMTMGEKDKKNAKS